ncbi:creatininase family protein [Kaistia dalseonensis]|uniref:Creatinine amidohydrolase n=1 Tax=Kaistia dalseonensis TaxID=410840 RepID=A0ABU0H7A0_9HYPH|nr:creatininase family protein [Kaistia dalseonensis]MCX5495321.1 creatininase family protein [Kaistia dalseonensis]MDQ0437907.1 creatinine amidohydrolase [Kaistia dalseonensis]
MPLTLPPSRQWIDLTTFEAGALPRETVVLLPVAAVEQHGPHLPIGTDALINRGIVARMLELLPKDVPFLVLPEQTAGTSQEHIDFAGTISFEPPHLMRIWSHVLVNVRRAGINRVIIFNSHGGQTGLLAPVAVDLRAKLGMFVAYASWFDAGYPEGLFSDEEIRHGMHGGAIETSLMLHLRPDLVRTDLMADFHSKSVDLDVVAKQISANPGDGRLGGFGWKAADLNSQGVTGDASVATAEAGRILLDHLAGALALLVQEMAKAVDTIEG